MLEVTLLGTGGTVPLPERWLTSCLVRWNGQSLLIDCGEGTQIALHKKGFSCKQINTILLTHYHADHIAGLPGLLLTMAKSDRTEPVTIIGPKGLHEIMQGIFILARYIPFEVKCIEIDPENPDTVISDLKITAFTVKHSVPCVGYAFNLKRARKFDRTRAEEQNIPVRFWGKLQKGMTIEEDGMIYTPDMVLGEERQGIRMVYATDTRPCMNIINAAENADLLITEGMYGDPEKLEKAKKNKHMLMQEAAETAVKANVSRLWLTHYSPSVSDPSEYEETVKEIFEGTVISKDGQSIDIAFRE